jgi:hypothetical protein
MGPERVAKQAQGEESRAKLCLMTHVAFYAGWPCAVNAGRIAIEVCGEK